MTHPIRVIVPIDCELPDAWSTALALAETIGASAQPAVREFILLTHTKQQLKQSSLFENIGPEASKALLAKKNVPTGAGGTLRHTTVKTLSSSVPDSIVVAYFGDEGMLEKIDGLVGVKGVVVVPETTKGVETWKERWGAEIHGQASTPPVKQISDKVVEKALQQLSRNVNLSNASLNVRDELKAKETLNILRAYGHALDPEKIKSWALQNNWKLKSAGQLSSLSAKIQGLKAKPSTKSYENVEDRYRSWN